MPAWDKGYETHTKSRPGSIPKDCYTISSEAECLHNGSKK